MEQQSKGGSFAARWITQEAVSAMSEVEGDWLEWDYRVTDHAGRLVMTAQKELLRWTDTYTIDIAQPEDVLLCLMIVLAIDAAKCSSGN